MCQNVLAMNMAAPTVRIILPAEPRAETHPAAMNGITLFLRKKLADNWDIPYQAVTREKVRMISARLTGLFSKNVPAPKIAPRVTKKRPADPACSKPMSPSRIAKPATAAPLAKMIARKDTTPPRASAMKSPPT